ncbi:unnamed protein product, partial [Cladocopium goreaui]
MSWGGKSKKRDRIRVKFVQCKPQIVRDTIRLVGWRECDAGDDNWDVAWGDTTAALFRGVQQLKPFQRVNHFPLMQIICRKDLLAQHLQTIRQLCPHGTEEFSFFPETWVLPGDVQRFWGFVRHSFERRSKEDRLHSRDRSKSRGRRSLRGTSADTSEDEEEDSVLTFIAKPRAAARGNGIFLFQVRASDVRAPRNRLKEVLDSEKLVVQSFLSKPLLIDGYKWDMRVYVLVTDVHPLTVYLYTDGLARFCTDLYEAPDEDNLDMREMHLTNFSINWESEAFEDTEDGATGSKRSLRTVLESVEGGDNIWLEIAECVKKTLLAIGPKMQDNYDRYFGRSRDGGGSACFELLGFDFILDEEQRLFLLEVNSAPSLSTPTNLDEEIKESVLTVFRSWLLPYAISCGQGFRLLGLDGSEKAVLLCQASGETAAALGRPPKRTLGKTVGADEAERGSLEAICLETLARALWRGDDVDLQRLPELIAVQLLRFVLAVDDGRLGRALAVWSRRRPPFHLRIAGPEMCRSLSFLPNQALIEVFLSHMPELTDSQLSRLLLKSCQNMVFLRNFRAAQTLSALSEVTAPVLEANKLLPALQSGEAWSEEAIRHAVAVLHLTTVDVNKEQVKSIPGFVSFLEDSEDETETESEQSEEGWTDEDDEQEEDEEVCEEFSFLGTPVSIMAANSLRLLGRLGSSGNVELVSECGRRAQQGDPGRSRQTSTRLDGSAASEPTASDKSVHTGRRHVGPTVGPTVGPSDNGMEDIG